MRAIRPSVKIPGDNERAQLLYSRNEKGYSRESELRAHIMARSGDCIGMSEHAAVWRFGFTPLSEAGQAYGVFVPEGRGPFFWYLTARKTGGIIEEFEGAAIDLPQHFRDIMNWGD